MGLVPTMNLPVAIETAWVRQLLAADLALDGGLAIGPNLPGPDAAHGMLVQLDIVQQ